MRNNRQIRWILLAAIVTVSGLSGRAWAQKSARVIVTGRQKIQTALVVAMADGKLTAAEERSILHKANRWLPAAEKGRLKGSLTQSRLAPTVMPPDVGEEGVVEEEGTIIIESYKEYVPADAVVEDRSGEASVDDLPVVATSQTFLAISDDKVSPAIIYTRPSDVPDDTPTVAPSEESPFRDEALPEFEGSEAFSDASLMFADEVETVAEGFGMMAGSCMGWGASDTLWPSDGYHVSFLSTVDAFKGPLDLDNQNGNFGVQFGVNAGMPLSPCWGISVQAGTGVVLSDFHGTQFSGNKTRDQSFTTVGLSQRVPLGEGRLKYGFVFDWLQDDYFDNLRMSQWRVKLAYDLTPSSEIGLWANIPNDGDTALLDMGNGRVLPERFKPFSQGYFYWNRCFGAGNSITGWLGVAEEPGEMIFGGDAHFPISQRMSVVGNVNYITPSASGVSGQDEEVWNVSVGLELTLGRGRNICRSSANKPMFPLASNGSFAVRRF